MAWSGRLLSADENITFQSDIKVHSIIYADASTVRPVVGFDRPSRSQDLL